MSGLRARDQGLVESGACSFSNISARGYGVIHPVLQCLPLGINTHSPPLSIFPYFSGVNLGIHYFGVGGRGSQEEGSNM